MASIFSSVSCTNLAIIMMMIVSSQSQAQLQDEDYYESRCPGALNAIREVVTTLVRVERTMAAYLIRLHVNDCLVGGCDASLLLNVPGERDSNPNGNLDNVFEVIAFINSRVENKCDQVISCADVVAIAARDAAAALGAPTWPLRLGRLDSFKAETRAAADSNLPQSSSSLAQLKGIYSSKNFTEREMVALAGMHTIGKERCLAFRERVNGGNLTEIDPEFAREVREGVPCPADGSGDQKLRSFDSDNSDIWDNGFYKTLVAQRGLLDSDQALYCGSTGLIVEDYALNPLKFLLDFPGAMLKLTTLNPITDPKQGEIRNVCSTPS